MPKSNHKFTIRLDLLKPQSGLEKLPVKLFRWLLSSGRYMLVFVEVVVLLAFILRFKLDVDLASKKADIEKQIPYIESLRSQEALIKQTQLKLSTIGAFNQKFANYPQILTKIAAQIPAGIKITSMNFEKSADKVTIHINAQSQTNNDLLTFLIGLREDQSFADVNLTSVGLEQGIIRFTLDATAKVSLKGEKIL